MWHILTTAESPSKSQIWMTQNENLNIALVVSFITSHYQCITTPNVPNWICICLFPSAFNKHCHQPCLNPKSCTDVVKHISRLLYWYTIIIHMNPSPIFISWSTKKNNMSYSPPSPSQVVSPHIISATTCISNINQHSIQQFIEIKIITQWLSLQ